MLQHLLSIILSFIVLASAVNCVPSALLVRRDVAELATEPPNVYLATPAGEVDIVAESITDIPIEQSDENDYEYRTVRKLRLRKRRDVAHLKMHYLPPTNEYLQPVYLKAVQTSLKQPPPTNESFEPASVEELDVGTTEQPQPNNEYLAPVIVKESEISTEQPQPANEYFPTANLRNSEITNEISQTSNVYLPPARFEEFSEISKSEIELEPFAKSTKVIDPAEAAETTTVAALEKSDIESELPEDSAILLEDGYHYKKPVDIPNLLSPKTAPSGIFLPPLEEAIVEGPLDAEPAAIAEDVYSYRAIKRRS